MTPALSASREEKATRIPPKSPLRLASREVERSVPVNPNQGEGEKKIKQYSLSFATAQPVKNSLIFLRVVLNLEYKEKGGESKC